MGSMGRRRTIGLRRAFTTHDASIFAAAAAAATTTTTTTPVARPAAAKRKLIRSRSASPIAKRTRLQKSLIRAAMTFSSGEAGPAVVVPTAPGGPQAEGADRAEADACGATPPILLTLPPELLLTVLEYCMPYKEIARLRTVCRTFDSTCCSLIQTGFVKTQEQIVQRLRSLEASARDILESDDIPLSSVAKRILQRNLQQQQNVRLLDFQLQLVRALTWRYVESGLCPPPYSALVDACHSLLNGADKSCPRPRLHVHTCRNVAMRLLKNFLRHVQDHSERGGGDKGNGEDAAASPSQPCPEPLLAPSPAPPPFDIALPCACVIDLLELSQLAPTRTPMGVMFRPTRSHSVRLQATYDLDGCWFGVYLGTVAHGALHREDIHILTSILCDLVCSSTEARFVGTVSAANAREGDSSTERKTGDSDGTDENNNSPEVDPKTSVPRFRGRAPFRVYPRLHNPRQCYRGSIRESSGRIFAFGHSPGSRQALRVFLDLTASVSLVPSSLLRRLTPDTAALLQVPDTRATHAPLYRPPSLSEPFIPKCSPKDALVRNLPFHMELVMESNTDRVVYRSNA